MKGPKQGQGKERDKDRCGRQRELGDRAKRDRPTKIDQTNRQKALEIEHRESNRSDRHRDSERWR